MDIIALDPSLTCTAMVINDKKYVYTGTHVAFTEKGNKKSWFEICSNLLHLHTFDMQKANNMSYSDSEIHKINLYVNIVDTIFEDIKNNIKDIKNCKIGIEGYSYSSSSGPLIDLVSFGSLIRSRFISFGCSDITIIPPQQLKTSAASLVYTPFKKGKILKYVNNKGTAAGSFKKQDMLQCLLDDPSMNNDPWVGMLRDNSEKLLDLKATPKPIEDVNDAKLLYEWLKRK